MRGARRKVVHCARIARVIRSVLREWVQLRLNPCLEQQLLHSTATAAATARTTAPSIVAPPAAPSTRAATVPA